jgi:hypothetical protein
MPLNARFETKVFVNDIPYYSHHIRLPRLVLQGAWRGTGKPLVNFWLIIEAFCYQHKQ